MNDDVLVIVLGLVSATLSSTPTFESTILDASSPLTGPPGLKRGFVFSLRSFIEASYTITVRKQCF